MVSSQHYGLYFLNNSKYTQNYYQKNQTDWYLAIMSITLLYLRRQLVCGESRV